jgi:hypothetical protein
MLNSTKLPMVKNIIAARAKNIGVSYLLIFFALVLDSYVKLT